MPLLLTLTSDVDLDDDQVMTQVVGPAGLTIGRGLDNDWIIKDPRRLLSKHHCRLDASGATFIITDTSTNGVFLNESPTPLGRGNTAVVSDGDRLRLGELDVVVQAIPEADAAALAGLSADPFAPRSGPFATGAGESQAAAPGDDDPWGGWVPPGGQGGQAEGGPFGRPQGVMLKGASQRSSSAGFEADGQGGDGIARDGPMPPGDRLFGQAPGASVGPWGDDDRDQWAAVGADADDAAPEALAFAPAAASLTSVNTSPDGIGEAPAPDPTVAAEGPIPEDWDAEVMGCGPDGGSGDGGASPVSIEGGLDPAASPPPTPIPEDFDAEAAVAPAGDLAPGPAVSTDRHRPPEALALMAALDDCLAMFAPAAIEGRLPRLGDPDAMPPAVRQARAWAAYEARYPDLRRDVRCRLAEALGIDAPEDG